MEELGEFLEGRVNEFYRTIACVLEPSYEVGKQWIIKEVGRIRGRVKFRMVNNLDKVRMGNNKRIDVYLQGIEPLTRKRFGKEGINENKDLFRCLRS